MKLVFCPECHDIFKLDLGYVRHCYCGLCKGKYTDNLHAVTNGEGLCIAIANPDIEFALRAVKGDKVTAIRCWGRPHEGKDNPHSKIEKGDMYGNDG